MRRPRPVVLLVAAAIGCAEPEERSRPDPDGSRPAPATSTREGEDPRSPAASVPEFRLRLDAPAHTVSAQVELDVPGATAVHLLFRSEFEGYPDLGGRLRNLEARGPGGPLVVARPVDGLGSGHYSIDVSQSQRVRIEYTLALDPPNDSRLYHRVSQLAAAGGHLLGRDFMPRLWLGQPRAGLQPVELRFSGMPPDWHVATVEPRAGTGYGVADIIDAVFVVGPLRQRQLNLGPRSLVTAVYGRWPNGDERVFDAIRRAAGSLHRIAGDGWARGDYVIGAGRVPAAVPGQSTGGQVIGHSGITYVAGSAPADLEFHSWLYTTTHELTHWYIPTGFRFEGQPPSWFAEGFTDYMALRILLVAGLIEPQEFLDEIGTRWMRYRGSPLYGQTSIVDAEADFWSDDAYQYIYDGGSLAAFLLDLGFQDRGSSLERTLKEVRRAEPVTAESLTAALAAVRENRWIEDWLADGTNPDWESRFEQYGLTRRNDSLVSLNDWATNALSSIRP
jgi:predicted metalloprotease with PDZ domain